MQNTLTSAAYAVLTTADATEKCEKTRAFAARWRGGEISKIGTILPPDRPNRPDKPVLLSPAQMPKREKAGSDKLKAALLHALAHIELNAVDLAWDIIARFSPYYDGNNAQGFTLPRDFYDDWLKVADDEAKHFLMLRGRLHDLGSDYGALPAHDGLWESATRTAHDFVARLAIVPMVLEARGLDVTPNMIATMRGQNDHVTADMLQIIHDDEVTHVRAGTRWFEHWCAYHNKDMQDTWQDLVREYFHGKLKRPFNHPSREDAGMIRDWYEPLAD